MASEPDNLALVHLREIRADLATLTAKVDKIDRDNETFKFQLTHTFGLAGMANLQSQLAQGAAEEMRSRQKQTEARFAEIERRVKRTGGSPGRLTIVLVGAGGAA